MAMRVSHHEALRFHFFFDFVPGLFVCIFSVRMSVGGGLVQWLASRTSDQGVPGSRPGRVAIRCGLGASHIYPLLSTG